MNMCFCESMRFVMLGRESSCVDIGCLMIVWCFAIELASYPLKSCSRVHPLNVQKGCFMTHDPYSYI